MAYQKWWDKNQGNHGPKGGPSVTSKANKAKTTIIRSLENTRMTIKQPVFTWKGDSNGITICNNGKRMLRTATNLKLQTVKLASQVASVPILSDYTDRRCGLLRNARFYDSESVIGLKDTQLFSVTYKRAKNKFLSVLASGSQIE